MMYLYPYPLMSWLLVVETLHFESEATQSNPYLFDHQCAAAACEHIFALIAATFCLQVLQEGLDLLHICGEGMNHLRSVIIIVSVANKGHSHPCKVTHALKTICDDLLDFLGQVVQVTLHRASEIKHEAKVQGLDLTLGFMWGLVATTPTKISLLQGCSRLDTNYIFGIFAI